MKFITSNVERIAPPVADYGFWDWIGPILEHFLDHFPIGISILELQKENQSSLRIRRLQQGGDSTLVPQMRLPVSVFILVWEWGGKIGGEAFFEPEFGGERTPPENPKMTEND